ncbi:MAG: hypothetical protein LQ343_001979 [Gyalolechia ehrenbergii]|nr:MAG: hypothetical protein LQ343_001979 [Gyalolechia ehrenbergii]
MKTAASLAVAIGATAAFAGALTPRATTPKVTVKGNAFFAGSDRFYIRGVDYQPGGASDAADPIADTTLCKRDIAEFKKLGINTVRIYTIDNSKDHTECMKELADAGIYLALDVNTPKYSIRRDKPDQSYNSVYLQNVFATIDEFQKYDNTLMFFSGNELINDVPTSNTAPFVKAVTRDIKQYMGNRGYRKIPVGYSAADINDNRIEAAHYFNCGTDDERSDFFAFNDYSWCDPSTYEEAWKPKVDALSNYSIPIFLSEFGCVETKSGRKFGEIPSLYDEKVTPVYSGGLVYEYTKEGDAAQQKYGLVDVQSPSSVTERPDFALLQKAFQANQPPKGDGGYKSGGEAAQCPSRSDTWLVDNDGLPAMPPKAKAFFKNGAGDGVGLEGEGSQEVGAESTGIATPGSGAVTATGSSSSSTGSSTGDSKGAASGLRAPDFTAMPLVCGMVVLLSSLLGGAILL